MAERRESVRLELNDAGFSTGMVKAAAATSLLNKELSSLSRRATTTDAKIEGLTGKMSGLRKEFDGFPAANISGDFDSVSKSARDTDTSINQLTGRIRLFADAAAVLGPALVPLGGVAVAGIAGLSAQMGFAAVAGGVLIGSMQGLGDALSALNDAHLEPTAQNLAKAEDALNQLSPAAANFAREAYGMLPALREIRDAGAEALFPGLTESLDDLERLAPVVGRIFESVGGALGDIASDSAASLASDRWAEFFEFIADEAPRALSELASTVGDITHGLAELWMAFTPLNNDFSGWLMDVADGFDSWATGLDQTQGFQDFIDYIRTTGPRVAETLGALGNALVQIVQAAAPIGGPVLKGIEALADAVAAIAGSDIGGPILAGVAALTVLNRTLSVTQSLGSGGGMFSSITGGAKSARGGLATMRADIAAVSDKMVVFGANTEKAAAASSRLKGQAATFGKSAALLGGLAVAGSGAADGIGLSNTASLALMGTIAGPWGAAIGGGVGLLLDWKAAGDNAAAAARDFDDSLKQMTLSQLKLAEAEEKQRLIDEGFGADRSKLDAIQAQIAATGALAAEENRLAGQSAYRDSIEAETAAIQKNIAAMQAKRDAAIQSFSAQTNYSQSLLDSKAALEDNGRAWNLNTEAGLKNRRAVEAQASSWNELNRTQGQTPGQARKARAALEDTAVSLGATKEQARQYAKQLLDIPNDLKTKIALDVDTAIQRAKAIKAELASIDRNIDVYINVRRPNAGGFGPQVGASADGGTVPKTGKPYADRHLYLLADGEEVISNRNGQADRHRALLKSINGGLADGGTTGGDKPKRRTRAFSVTDNTDALQAALDRLTARTDEQSAAVDAQRKALEGATEATEFWGSKMADVAKGTVSGFDSGLFGRDSNVWASGAGGGATFNLNRDIAGLQERSGLQAQLAAAGLSGDALAAILSEGTNADISALLASGQAGSVGALFNQRAALQGSVGAAAGQLAYGAQYAEADKARQKQLAALGAQLAEQQASTAAVQRMEAKIASMSAQVAALNADQPERIGAVINGAASKGHREKQWRNK